MLNSHNHPPSTIHYPISDSIFLKACRREKTEVTPVWLMRQAGRYMKDYRAVREKMSFLELCKDPAWAAEVTVAAQKQLGVDAAIIFSDILVVFEPMGLKLTYQKQGGPLIAPTFTKGLLVDHLIDADPTGELAYVYEAIRESRKGLPRGIPLIGFVGAPFTLASYMIEGGSTKDFTATKKFMIEDFSRWDVLMKKIVRVVTAHLNGQIAAGAEAAQIFDSWAGILSPEEYARYAMPYTRSLIEGLKKGVPVIHFGTKTSSFIEKIHDAGGDVIGVDDHISLDAAWKRIGYDKAIQGNLSPLILCGDLGQVRAHTRRILDEVGGRPGHIFNLGHGVLPTTPEENAKALVDMVHEMSKR